jgi:Zn-dependent peptidase ImmA (M78 family)
MLFVSGKSQHTKLTFKVYDFFRELYDVKSDVEVFHTNLTDDNAFGFTEENGDEQFIQIHNDLSEKDFITTLLHELVHVMQNENGITDDKIREEEAYLFEDILYNQYLQSV